MEFDFDFDDDTGYDFDIDNELQTAEDGRKECSLCGSKIAHSNWYSDAHGGICGSCWVDTSIDELQPEEVMNEIWK